MENKTTTKQYPNETSLYEKRNTSPLKFATHSVSMVNLSSHQDKFVAKKKGPPLG
jgi:hypothetical protein